ncbi:hypothetical protein [Halobellus marinus]|uniref:hypothetical protein n=1 Tax=Halobellus TaxID=1073986 RepID=UPI0028AF7325|nr:hypothetical protein [Halobellus sp. DFY28]
MTAESPWDDDRRFYGKDDFGDTSFEDEHYSPNDAGEFFVDEAPRCTQCDRPVDPDRALCKECERDKELESGNPYGPIYDDVSVTYEKRIDDLAFAVVPAKSRFEAIVKATLAFDARENAPKTPAGYDGVTFELLHEADESDIRSFNIGWGALPEAVPVASERGLELFNKAHNRTNWGDHLSEGPEVDFEPEPDIYLYDEDGTAICRAGQFIDLIDSYTVPDDPSDYTQPEYGSTDEELWIVPAFTLSVHPTTDG